MELAKNETLNNKNIGVKNKNLKTNNKITIKMANENKLLWPQIQRWLKEKQLKQII